MVGVVVGVVVGVGVVGPAAVAVAVVVAVVVVVVVVVVVMTHPRPIDVAGHLLVASEHGTMCGVPASDVDDRRWPTCPACAEAVEHPPLSATSLDTFTLCERKWGWTHLEGIRGRNKYADAGINAHVELEAWLKHKKLPTSKVVQRAIQHFPHPGAGVEAEEEFDDVIEGFHLTGKIDCTDYNVPRILDLKTTGNMKWAKTPDELLSDIQAAIYVLRTCNKHGWSKIACRWVYTERSEANGRCRPVDFEMTIDRAWEVFDSYRGATQKIRVVRDSALTTQQLTPNWNACEQYGGCPFKQHCEAAPSVIASKLYQKTIEAGRKGHHMAEMSIAEKMKAAVAAAKARAVPVQESMPAPAAPAPEAPVTSMIERARAAKAAPAPKAAPELPSTTRPTHEVVADLVGAATAHLERHLASSIAYDALPVDLLRAEKLLVAADLLKRLG